MAEDTRKKQDTHQPGPPEETPVRRPRRPKPKHEFPQTQAGKMWEALGNPEAPANSMPGGMVNTAGGRPPEVTWRDAFKFYNFSKTDLTRFYRTQCARDSLLVGICAGGAFGGARFVVTGLSTVKASANYAVGAFVLASCGMYYWCDQRRREEAQGIAMAVAGMKMLNEKKARERAQDEAVQAARLAENERNKDHNWYKFW